MTAIKDTLPPPLATHNQPHPEPSGRPRKDAVPAIADSALSPDRQPYDKIARVIEDHVREMTGVDKKLTIEIDKDAGVVVYKAIDRSTGQVLRQYPSEEMLKILTARRQAEGQDLAGLSVDGKA